MHGQEGVQCLGWGLGLGLRLGLATNPYPNPNADPNPNPYPNPTLTLALTLTRLGQRHECGRAEQHGGGRAGDRRAQGGDPTAESTRRRARGGLDRRDAPRLARAATHHGGRHGPSVRRAADDARVAHSYQFPGCGVWGVCVWVCACVAPWRTRGVCPGRKASRVCPYINIRAEVRTRPFYNTPARRR